MRVVPWCSRNQNLQQAYSWKKYFSAKFMLYKKFVPEIHSPEGEVELQRLGVDIAEGSAEHGQSVEGDDAVGRVDHQVLRQARLTYHFCILNSVLLIFSRNMLSKQELINKIFNDIFLVKRKEVEVFVQHFYTFQKRNFHEAEKIFYKFSENISLPRKTALAGLLDPHENSSATYRLPVLL